MDFAQPQQLLQLNYLGRIPALIVSLRKYLAAIKLNQQIKGVIEIIPEKNNQGGLMGIIVVL